MEESSSAAASSKIEEREGDLFDAPDGAALIRMSAQLEKSQDICCCTNYSLIPSLL